MNRTFYVLLSLIITFTAKNNAQSIQGDNVQPVQKVNVFLGTSGDHGQLSPAASSPFNMMSIGPQTTPHIHTGYEHYAREFDGFTHTRIEGVGCMGSGGNILIKPILQDDVNTDLSKKKENASPGFYEVLFENGINASMSVDTNFGIHSYEFPREKSGLFIDFSFSLVNRFVSEEHRIKDNIITGSVDTKTTCGAGVYRIYYAMSIDNMETIKSLEEHQILAIRENDLNPMQVRIAFSSVNTDYAFQKIGKASLSLDNLRKNTTSHWNKLLQRVQVAGEKDREDLFYSLLYRGLQAPYLISEKDGVYRAIDGSKQSANFPVYNGWAIWDNYREQLPMLSLLYPDKFGAIAKSIANLYPYGKKNWSTMHEPSPTVRTEHAIVVLLDAYRKAYDIDFESIRPFLLEEIENLDYSSPDKALESSYDNWAMSEILKITGDSLSSKKYQKKALDYKQYWSKDFADLTKNDIDQMQARGLYQGTIWQYRWFVPFDVKGLKKIAGGEEEFIKQLDQFFDENNYNHANQPDLQVPGLYNATNQPWKSQKLFRNLMLDTVVQNYFNNNSKGVNPYIGRIYKNKPKAFLRTMDDDAGTMSSWFVMRSLGLSPANIGEPVYYLTAPIFKSVKISLEDDKSLNIEVSNYHQEHFYIQSVTLNGKRLDKNWLTQSELNKGGKLIIETGSKPNKKWGIKDRWIAH